MTEGWFKFGSDTTATKLTIRDALIKWAVGYEDTSPNRADSIFAIYNNVRLSDENALAAKTAKQAVVAAIALPVQYKSADPGAKEVGHDDEEEWLFYGLFSVVRAKEKKNAMGGGWFVDRTD